MKTAQGDLEGRILGCVDRGLLAIGESGRHVIYWHMEQDKHLSRESIAKEPRKFIEALQGMFGPGAATLEKTIVREMKTEFRISGDIESFEEAVEEASRREGVAKG
jgi:hypothetical protein